MKCSVCRYEMPDDFRYCPVCGTMRPDPLMRPAGMKLRELYAVWCAASHPHLSRNSINTYRRAWERIAADCSERDIGCIKTEELQRVASKISYEDAKKFRSLFRQMYELASEGKPIHSPVEKIVLPRRMYRRREAFKPYEVAKMWEAYHDGDRDAAYALILIYTGMRTGEFGRLKEKNIDFALRTITDIATKNEKCAMKPVIVPRIIVPVLESLCIGNPEHLLVSMNRESFYKLYYSFLDRIRVRSLSPHCCRHTCATLLARKNVPLAVTQQVMRHADSRTTLEVYTHLDTEDAHSAMDSLEEE